MTAADTEPPHRPAPEDSGGGPAGRWTLFADGVRLALTTLTVTPMRVGVVDRRTAAVAMSVAPAIGIPLGAILAAVLMVLHAAGAPPLLAAAVTLGTGTLLTRALHLDGLADTVDALGSYRSGEAGLAIMKKPDIGPFGVATLTLALLTQAAALTALPGTHALALVTSVITALTTGRLAISWACHRSIPAAGPTGLGALVAATVPAPVLAVTTAATIALSAPAVPARPWQGPLAVILALAATLLLLRQCRRRFGGHRPGTSRADHRQGRQLWSVVRRVRGSHVWAGAFR
ncbi:adenosylcobinamide-GDP ribazoletransferase [Catenuloplanes japonicus]|uniref:adenosylcobinamide-GDP ribazoletransferase n=1 Tax=Catenuloplanes japonicus TaxID=33876 RepID=UPI00068AD687|nr:adenosylcobinamide-GDP ribazoletransferase [Catenuloplanes japonicus]